MHPSLEELIEFVQGRMDPAVQAGLETHIEGCDACCKLLRTAPNDTLLEKLIATKKQPPLPAAPAESTPGVCQSVSEFLEELDTSGILSVPHRETAGACAGQVGTAARLAEMLVERKILTPWQSDRLLHKAGATLVLDKYQLLSLLGTGGMAQVFLARHTKLNRQVAIKLLPRTKVINGSYLERFHREAQLVAALDHKNIVRAYHADNVGKQHFLVMEYIEGPNLAELVERDGPLSFATAGDYIAQAAEGLAHAHEAGIVHRDIKPANLLLDSTGTIKILDMGLGRLSEPRDNSITERYDDRLIGTSDYMAPEQALDAHAADTRADIYSLGGTLYFLLTGRPPFPTGTVAERLMKHQREEPESILKARPECPRALLSICQRMMAKRPEERFQTPAEVARALRRWLSGEIDPAGTVPAGSMPAPARSIPAGRWRVVAAAASAAVLLGAIGWQVRERYRPATAELLPAPAPKVPEKKLVPEPNPRLVAARALLADHELVAGPQGLYVHKSEGRLLATLEQIAKDEEQLVRGETEFAAFRAKYRKSVADAADLEAQRTAARALSAEETDPQKKAQADLAVVQLSARIVEATKELVLLPQHHNTFEIARHQARVGLIERIQKAQAQADGVKSSYEIVRRDSRIAETLATLSSLEARSFALGPSDEARQALEQAKGLAGRLVREEIPLVAQGTVLLAELTFPGGQKQLLEVYPPTAHNQISEELAQKLALTVPAVTARVPIMQPRDEKGNQKHTMVPEIVLEQVSLGPLTNQSVRMAVLPQGLPVRPGLSAAFFYGRICQWDAKAKKLHVTRLKDEPTTATTAK
jgi:hypothetical protein